MEDRASLDRKPEWDRLRQRHLRASANRPPSSAQGLHHIAISVTQERWDHLKAKIEAAGIKIVFHDRTSIYFMGPDSERLELIADDLGEMYGNEVL